MNKSSHASKIIGELKDDANDRKTRTLSLNIKIFDDAKHICEKEGIPISRLVDRLLFDFITKYEEERKELVKKK